MTTREKILKFLKEHDGDHATTEIAKGAGIGMKTIKRPVRALADDGTLVIVTPGSGRRASVVRLASFKPEVEPLEAPTAPAVPPDVRTATSYGLGGRGPRSVAARVLLRMASEPNREWLRSSLANVRGYHTKLLARLAERGLVRKTYAGGKGRGNANDPSRWRLTEAGLDFVRSRVRGRPTAPPAAPKRRPGKRAKRTKGVRFRMERVLGAYAENPASAHIPLGLQVPTEVALPAFVRARKPRPIGAARGRSVVASPTTRMFAVGTLANGVPGTMETFVDESEALARYTELAAAGEPVRFGTFEALPVKLVAVVDRG